MNKLFRILIILIAIGVATWGFSYTYIWYFRYTKEDRELTNITSEELIFLPEEKRLDIKEKKQGVALRFEKKYEILIED